LLFCCRGEISIKEGLGKMKVVVCLGLALPLVGCMTAQEQQLAAVGQCQSEKTPPEWMRCLNEPEARIAGRETLLMAYEHRRTRQPQRPQTAPRVSEGTEREANQ
jgi:hypothetical protein